MRDFNSFPKVFVASFLVFFIFQYALVNWPAFWRWASYYSVTTDDDRLRFDADLVTKKNDQSKILFIGSSQLREAVDDEVLNASDPYHSYVNMGVAAATWPTNLYPSTLTAISIKPQSIVFMPVLESFFYQPSYKGLNFHTTISIIPFFLKHPLCFKFPEVPNRLIEGFIGNIFFVFRYQESLRNIVFRGLFDAIGVEKWQQKKAYDYDQDKPESYFQEVLSEFKDSFPYFHDVSCTAMNFALFEETARILQKQHIQLVVIDAPVHPYYAQLAEPDLFARYNNQLHELADKYEFTYMTKSDYPVFTKEDFIDFTHVNARGRAKFTSFLSKYFKNQ